MADWSGMQTVDPKILQKKRREEEKRKKLKAEKQKQREQKIKIIAFFSGIAMLFFIFFLYVWNNESRIRQEKKDELKKITLKVIKGTPQFETTGVFKNFPQNDFTLEKAVFSIKTDASSVAVIEIGIGIQFKILENSIFSFKTLELNPGEKTVKLRTDLKEGALVYSKDEQPIYKTDFEITTPRINVNQNAPVSGKIKVESHKTDKIDKITSFNLICKVKPKNGPEQIVQPSYVYVLDNKGTPNMNFVTVSAKNW